MKDIASSINSIIEDITGDYKKGRAIDKMEVSSQPSRDEVVKIIKQLQRIVFPGYYVDRTYRIYNINTNIATLTEDLAYHLQKQIALALRFCKEYENATYEVIREASEDITVKFMKQIPEIRELLDTDVEALFEGDPAAESKDAIIISYPGLLAITVQRFAHVLYQMNVPVLPRVMTEYAHSRTGIDINPGAVIGKYFFIDHGTGIVIGETTEIGEHVKLYQGVTLGALSTRAGRQLSNKKRHPTIEDNVTIYSGASILGGDTVIGKGSVIGGNVFLTNSIPANTRVYIKSPELFIDEGGVKEVGKKKRGLIFDMDGTLWDSAEGVAKSWSEKASEMLKEERVITTEDIQGVMGMTMDKLAAVIFPDLDEKTRMDVLDQCGKYENAYLEEHGGILYPDLEETLKKLQKKFHLYIVSNCQSGYIEAFLTHYGFGKYFEDIECYGNNLLGKADNIKLLYDRNELDEAYYVGDIQADYEASTAAGVPFIHASYGFGKMEQETAVIKTFAELDDVAEELFGGISSDKE